MDCRCGQFTIRVRKNEDTNEFFVSIPEFNITTRDMNQRRAINRAKAALKYILESHRGYRNVRIS